MCRNFWYTLFVMIIKRMAKYVSEQHLVYLLGTTANVGMKIYGEYGKTSSKQLDKKWAFQRNAQDTFIMAHDTNLGNIEKIMIWHDNSGLDPSWYLVQVIVKDLQTDVKYYFFANFWMSLEMEKGFVQKELTAAGLYLCGKKQY